MTASIGWTRELILVLHYKNKGSSQLLRVAAAYEANRRVSTTLRQVLTEFSDVFHVTGTGLLIQTSLGSCGGLGALPPKRSG